MRSDLESQAPDLRWKGWKVKLGDRPLATPAVADGKVFVGGGFGSHDFVAINAKTGKFEWGYRTHDDGPTAAIVEEDLLLFNTESCEIEALTLDGKAKWKWWLGDPLLSMPAASGGRVFIVFPDSQGDRRHYLGALDLRTGRKLWRRVVNGDAITAPVLADDNVYLTTLDGTFYCFEQKTGKLISQEPQNATSSPTVWNGKTFFSRRHQVQEQNQPAPKQSEMLSQTWRGGTTNFGDTMIDATYLDYSKRGGSLSETMSNALDATVGFAYSKGHAAVDQAKANIGQGTVAGIWSYQGSRPFVYRDRLFCSMGEHVQCVDPENGNLCWKTRATHADGNVLDQPLTPPAIVNGKVFVGTRAGKLLCLSADSGGFLWKINLGEPIVFQPAIANGRAFVTSSKGSVYCVETGDPLDDGWPMWGGGPGHNGAVRQEVRR